jgi:deoxyribodipyrimidine photo-lyase
MQTQLCWFRTDLRVRDNPALSNALASGPTRAFYIATPEQWQLHDDAPIKLDFWRRNLIELSSELKKINVELLFFQVANYKEIPQLLQQILDCMEVSQLHYNRELPFNEKHRDELVNEVCSHQGVKVSSFDDQLLVPQRSVLNQSSLPFKVFTPFARKALVWMQNNPPLYAEEVTEDRNTITFPSVPILPHQCELADISWPQQELKWSQDWPAGEEAAKARLEKFTQTQISDYKCKRDIPSLNATSQLSAYLSTGVISVAECWRKAQKYFDDSGVETWRNELLWREFYRYTVHHFPHICKHKAYRENMNYVPWRHDPEDFEKWCHGQTGYPLVDAGMRQLLATGWMHNRLRMVTAMFLSKHLLIDWRWGERWFMQNLIDGDFASNNGGWQWSASTGVDAVPYFRIFNPTRQAERFDPEGDFIQHYVPELKTLKKNLIHNAGAKKTLNYPTPMVDHKFARERAILAFKTGDSPDVR